MFQNRNKKHLFQFFDRARNILNNVVEQDVNERTSGLFLAGEGMRVLNEVNEFYIKKQQKMWVKREWDRICDCIDRLLMLTYVLSLGFGFWISYNSF